MGIKKLEDGSVIFACTDEDMRAGGYIAPRDSRAAHRATDEEKAALQQLFNAFQALKNLGWRKSMYAPQDGSAFLAIEAGSTGVHECIRRMDGHFWVYDGDLWPSHPILWKPIPQEEPDAS